VVERAPTVDVGSTAQKTVIDSEIVRRTPVRGRTYESVLTNAPGASTDEVGYSFNGATGPENTFLIDGLNSTNPAYGLVGTRLSLEFIDETHHRVRYLRRPFQREPDFGVTSVNYRFAELLGRAGEPA
jgi:hypothetical protein